MQKTRIKNKQTNKKTEQKTKTKTKQRTLRTVKKKEGITLIKIKKEEQQNVQSSAKINTNMESGNKK